MAAHTAWDKMQSPQQVKKAAVCRPCLNRLPKTVKQIQGSGRSASVWVCRAHAGKVAALSDSERLCLDPHGHGCVTVKDISKFSSKVTKNGTLTALCEACRLKDAANNAAAKADREAGHARGRGRPAQPNQQ